MSAIDDEIKIAEKRLLELRESKAKADDKEKADRQLPLRDLATKAHDGLCIYNHADGCGWGYEHDNWNGWTHKRWLDKIEKIVADNQKWNKITIAELEAIIDTITATRKIHPNALNVVDEFRRNF